MDQVLFFVRQPHFLPKIYIIWCEANFLLVVGSGITIGEEMVTPYEELNVLLGIMFAYFYNAPFYQFSVRNVFYNSQSGRRSAPLLQQSHISPQSISTASHSRTRSSFHHLSGSRTRLLIHWLSDSRIWLTIHFRSGLKHRFTVHLGSCLERWFNCHRRGRLSNHTMHEKKAHHIADFEKKKNNKPAVKHINSVIKVYLKNVPNGPKQMFNLGNTKLAFNLMIILKRTL